jgi:NAD(P)H-hydrate repair Nnr-like enzyme with NAD(P)H-hydrate dehydratase domain
MAMIMGMRATSGDGDAQAGQAVHAPPGTLVLADDQDECAGVDVVEGQPLVLDADALNLLAASNRQVADAVLTPHPGEAARLLCTDTISVQRDRFAAAAALVTRYNAATVLKGAGTIVSAPGELPCVIGAGNPGMAVGGMGDLLTGVIADARAAGITVTSLVTMSVSFQAGISSRLSLGDSACVWRSGTCAPAR